MDLAAFVGGSAFAFMLVFVRLGSAFLIMPTVGEQFVNPRIRLLFSLATTLLVTPVVTPQLPPAPSAPADLVALILAEVLVGLFIGTIARVMMSALEVAGHFIASQLGLSAAQAFNPALASPSTPVGALLGILALLLIFATDLHHMLILAVVDSYTLFQPGVWMPLGDVAQHMTRVVSQSFLVGMQMAAPFVVIGLMFYLGLGLVSRLVPTIQVFFVGLPIQTMLGTLLLSLSLSALMLFWLAAFEAQLIPLLTP
ncbi:flagellar biosynthetic protein FliR [Indioceanicola profundi]|uniref:flagellar biosynthetic protein FliR n=1 Tax=Indioceanicola profundi TaxID=2220096 RepID=UPI000E6AA3FB|nr:flagellar biosynthetic protein FliR [Indioceanicola profundi]